MKQSEFNYVTKVRDDMYGVFNTYKNSLAVFTEEEVNHLNNLDLATEEEIKAFYNLNFVVEDNVDERKETERDTLKYANDDRVIVRILTTLDCNANCVYCYEKRKPITMTKEIADQVIDFLRRITTHKIHIEWFGGEPLYNHEIISYICSKLYEFDIDFSSSIVTNAILATPEIISKFDYWRITRAQITLDGVEKEYDITKGVPYGTFNTVIENIKKIIDSKIDVTIRLNYLMVNTEELKNIIDYMANNIGYNEYLHYYAYPIFQLSNENKEFSPEIVDKIFEIQDYIISKGLDTSKHLYTMKYKGMGCFATHKNGYSIGPNGKLYGCSHAIETPIGDVVSGDYENRCEFYANIPEKCKTCIIYPLCKGGCKVGDLGLAKINQCNLYKNRFDEFVKRMVLNKLKEVEV